LTVAQYLGRLISHATSVINAPDYAVTIRDLARRRQLIAIAEEIAVAAYDVAIAPPVSSQIEAAGTRLFQLSEHGQVRRARRLDDVLPEVLSASAANFTSGTSLAGLSTGFAAVDGLLGDLRPGNLIVLAGRPAMGKSAFAEQIALNVARQGTPALFVSCEMSDGELARRACDRMPDSGQAY
jgi:replicative DNA helicase